MPSDVEDSSLFGEVLVVNNVDFSKPNIRQKTEKPPTYTIGERKFLQRFRCFTGTPHDNTSAASHLEKTPANVFNQWFEYLLSPLWRWMGVIGSGRSIVSIVEWLECT